MTCFARRFLNALEQEFGELKRSYDNFECLGVMREQDPKTFSIWTHRQHYVQQLRPLSRDKYVMTKDEENVSTDTHAAFMSLLGGIAWLTQTMPSIAIHASY